MSGFGEDDDWVSVRLLQSPLLMDVGILSNSLLRRSAERSDPLNPSQQLSKCYIWYSQDLAFALDNEQANVKSAMSMRLTKRGRFCCRVCRSSINEYEGGC